MAFDATFQHAIPGSSLTHQMGDLPHEKPPKYVDPNEALEFFWKSLNRPDMLKQIWYILENGGTAFAIARAILYKAALTGVIQMNLAVLLYPTVQKMIITIGSAKGIKVKLHPKMRDKLSDTMSTSHINKRLGRHPSATVPDSAGTYMKMPKPEQITNDAGKFHAFMKAHRGQQDAAITQNMPVQPADNTNAPEEAPAPVPKVKGKGLLSKMGGEQ